MRYANKVFGLELVTVACQRDLDEGFVKHTVNIELLQINHRKGFWGHFPLAIPSLSHSNPWHVCFPHRQGGSKWQGNFHGSLLHKAHSTFLGLGCAATSSVLGQREGQLQELLDFPWHGRGTLPQWGHCVTGDHKKIWQFSKSSLLQDNQNHIFTCEFPEVFNCSSPAFY